MNEPVSKDHGCQIPAGKRKKKKKKMKPVQFIFFLHDDENDLKKIDHSLFFLERNTVFSGL